jgi:Tfp pilus assembly protein PilV
MQSGRALGGARRAESGETLIEILMAVAVMGIAFVAILGAIFTAIRVSDYHRKTTTADIVLRDWAEVLKSPGINALGTGYNATYVACSVAGGTVSYPAYTAPAPNATYVATMTITYLTDATAATPAFQSTCPATDQGVQRLTLTVKGPSTDAVVQGKETVTIVKRNVANG